MVLAIVPAPAVIIVDDEDEDDEEEKEEEKEGQEEEEDRNVRVVVAERKRRCWWWWRRWKRRRSKRGRRRAHSLACRMQHEPRCPVSGAREPRQGDYEDGVRALSPLENSCRQSRRCSTFPHARRSYEETRSTRWHVHASDKLQGEKEEKKKDEKSEEKKVEKKEDEKGGASRTVVSVFGQVACQKEKTKGITDERRRIIHDHPAFFPPLSALPESVLVVATTVAATAVAITTSSIVTVLVVVLGSAVPPAAIVVPIYGRRNSRLLAQGNF